VAGLDDADEIFLWNIKLNATFAER